MGMVRKGTVTAKVPTKGGLQLDNARWIYGLPKELVESASLGDMFNENTKEILKVQRMVDNAQKIEDPRPTEAIQVEEKQPTIAATEPDKEPPYRAGYNQALSDYDLEKDAIVHVCGITQALIGGPLMNFIPHGVEPVVYVEDMVRQIVAMTKRVAKDYVA